MYSDCPNSKFKQDKEAKVKGLVEDQHWGAVARKYQSEEGDKKSEEKDIKDMSLYGRYV